MEERREQGEDRGHERNWKREENSEGTGDMRGSGREKRTGRGQGT